MPAAEALIGGEELSLAASQDFSPEWCKFGVLTPSFWAANPLGDWLVFLRALLTYLDDLVTKECFNFGRARIPGRFGQIGAACVFHVRLHLRFHERVSVILSDCAACESVSLVFTVNYDRLVTTERERHLDLVFPFPRVLLCWAANVVVRSGWHYL